MPARTANSVSVKAPIAPSTTWKERLHPKYFYSLIQANLLANLLLMSSLIIGFFHGWLKLRYPGKFTVFAYDIPLMLALVVSVAQRSPGVSFFPKSRTGSALQVVLGICILYGLLPTEIPLLVRLASFRGWALVPLVYLMGYHLFRSRELLSMYGSLILLLSLLTAIYGTRQDPEELRRMAEANASLEFVMRGAFYGDEEGTKFRVFSTFVSAGAFGGTMSYSLLIGLARLSQLGMKPWARIALMLVMLPIAYGILLSGSRGAIIIAAISILIIAWYRRSLLKFALPTAAVLGILLIATTMTGGSSVSRMSSAADPSALLSRLGIVIRPAMNRLMDDPIGGGLGRSGHGLPSSLGYLTSRYKWKPIDGDIGRVAVDFGIIGLVAFSSLFISGSRDALFWMKKLRGTDLETVAVTAGSMFIAAFVCFPVGSPFLAIPVGAIIWFHLGALNRLHDDYIQREKMGLRGSSALANVPALTSRAPARWFMHAPQPAPAAPPSVPTSATPVRPKRFLFQGRGSKSGPRS